MKIIRGRETEEVAFLNTYDVPKVLINCLPGIKLRSKLSTTSQFCDSQTHQVKCIEKQAHV